METVMKTLLRLPVSIVKTILSIAALPLGALLMISVVTAYSRPQTWFAKKKDETAET